MKSIWSGSLSFGMVNIPIKLYSTVEHSASPGFKLLHVEDKSPIEYRKFCKKQDAEVPWSEVVKGLEVEPGSFFLFTKEELASLRPEKSDAIEIVEFVPPDQIDRLLLCRAGQEEGKGVLHLLPGAQGIEQERHRTFRHAGEGIHLCYRPL